MKTRLQIGILSRGITRVLAGVGVALLCVCGGDARAVSAEELLEQGIYNEETKGDLKAAARLYRQIVDDPAATRALLAQAQLRLGLCQLKLGDKPQAILALEKLTRDFPDRETLLQIVGQHMPQVLDDMLNQIEQRYVHPIDRNDLLETALRAIVGKIDAAAGHLRTDDMAFLDAREVSQLKESLEQKVAGIGTALKQEEQTREVVVTAVLPRSPAFKGGILAGDRIAHVDDVPLARDAKLADVVKLLRGPSGSPVTVSVRRNGADELQRIQLVREVVQLASVKGRRLKAGGDWEFMLDDERKIGYVRLEHLGNQSPEEVRSALRELQGRGLKALILDVRSNPGGSLDDAIKVADLFVAHGTIVTVKGRDGEKAYSASAEGTFEGFPMAVLVNRKTASAAEIVAACLQDHGRAAVIGERTFGQGIVRTIVPLQGGVGALKLPVAAYYRPSGKNVNRYVHFTDADEWGVLPNAGCEVELGDEEWKELDRGVEEGQIEDRPLQKAFEYLAGVLAQSP